MGTADVDSGMAAELAALPAGARVAVVTMRGSLCPITLGHVQCFTAARALFGADRHGSAAAGAGDAQLSPAGAFAYCAGFI
eukprot:SAG22_NODE_7660_length_719_cov_1.820968_1_plen_80_part_01